MTGFNSSLETQVLCPPHTFFLPDAVLVQLVPQKLRAVEIVGLDGPATASEILSATGRSPASYKLLNSTNNSEDRDYTCLSLLSHRM